jgi:hypothetical protein
MLFFDAFFPLGRSNSSIPDCPRTQTQALSVMQRWDLDRALVFHTVSRDSDPEQGNRALEQLSDPALFPVWAFDPAFVIPEIPRVFLQRALAAGVKAVLINPLMRRIDLGRSPRISQLTLLLEQRRIPLLLTYWKTDPEQDVIDWYHLIDFCRDHPHLPVLVWEWRTRSNRPMFDALAATDNLRVAISGLWQAQSIAQICKVFGPERLVFSSGLPHLDPGSFQACLRYADIGDADKRQIAAGNLEELIEEADYG